MAITKSETCGLTATGFYSNDTDYIVPNTFEDVSLIYYTVYKTCNNDSFSINTIYRKPIQFMFSATGTGYPSNFIGNVTLSFDRELIFVNGIRSKDGSPTILNSTNWNMVTVNTSNWAGNYTWVLSLKDNTNQLYNVIIEVAVVNSTFIDSADFIFYLNSNGYITDNTIYGTVPQNVTISANGTIIFNDYPFGGTTDLVISNGVYTIIITQEGYTNPIDPLVGTFTLSKVNATQCIIAYCKLLCSAVQASTYVDVNKCELWALIEALKQADICLVCNSDICNILDYVQDIIDETNCKC